MLLLYFCNFSLSSPTRCLQLTTDLVDELRPFFKRLELVRLPSEAASHKFGNARHDPSWQLDRRAHLARARNRLLSAALGVVARQSIKWVLWMDADVRHIPRDLIRHLLSANQSVVVPNCLYREQNGQVGYIPPPFSTLPATFIQFPSCNVPNMISFSDRHRSCLERTTTPCRFCTVPVNFLSVV